jgi:folate-binding Fe-S cluster repair protein YgfZ
MAIVLLVACGVWLLALWPVWPAVQAFQLKQARRGSSSHCRGSLDYEYLPEAAAPFPVTNTWPSAYPVDTPASLRAEAVQAALVSGRGLWMQHPQQAVLHLSGPGRHDFVQKKFTSPITADSAAAASGTVTTSGFLTSRGGLVDLFQIILLNEVYLLPSMEYNGDADYWYERLQRDIFPLDRVTLRRVEPAVVFTLCSTQPQHLAQIYESLLQPALLECSNGHWPKSASHLPPLRYHSAAASRPALAVPLDNGLFCIMPQALLPSCCAVGYTCVFLGPTATGLGAQVSQQLLQHDQGPVELQWREWHNLRIHAGVPAVDYEMVGRAWQAARKERQNGEGTETTTKLAMSPPSPLELHLEAIVDLQKGCYQGQEGIASILKNPRGPPRALYQVLFSQEVNIFSNESDNLTSWPRVGDALYVLGSNEQIAVGTLTSVGEMGGSADASITALALLRRSDSILRQMSQLGLEIDCTIPNENGQAAPALTEDDPLDGLEVIVGGTFTVGRVRTVPGRRRSFVVDGKHMLDPDVNTWEYDREHFGDDVDQKDLSGWNTQAETLLTDDGEDPQALQEALEQAEAEMKAAEAEAKRKAEKMEQLKKRAEEALARRMGNKGSNVDEARG